MDTAVRGMDYDAMEQAAGRLSMRKRWPQGNGGWRHEVKVGLPQE